MGLFFNTNDKPTNSPSPAAFSTPRPLTAAAAQIKLNDKDEFEQFKQRRNSSSSAWQSEAWEYYDAIGEIKYSFNLVASVISRIRLYPAFIADPSQAPQPMDAPSINVDQRLSDAAYRALARLDSAYGGQAGLLRDLALNISVAGEALDVNTLVPTPTGFTKMGDLVAGDKIIAGDGSITEVLVAHPVQTDRPTYEITFDSGVTVVADADHLWEVYPVNKRRWAQIDGHAVQPIVLRTADMVGAIKHYGTTNYVVKRSGFTGGSSDLPIDPYILGYWLGDGWSSQGAITAHPADQPHITAELARAGYDSHVRNAGGGYQIGVFKFKADLQDLGVLNNKHVPSEYLRASWQDRLSLLQGLIDSDGHVSARMTGTVEFCNKNLDLLLAVQELAASLGLKPGRIRRRKDGTSRLQFRSGGVAVARLPRKAARLTARTERDKWDYIKSIVPVESRPVRCITVAHPEQTFAVTENFIRTHNCYLVQIPERVGHNLPESWDIKSVDEVLLDQRGGFKVIGRREQGTSNRGGGNPIILPQNAFIGRIWRSHPRYSDEADSSLRGLLDLCAELLLLNRTFRATARSRLNAGALYLPDGLAVASAMPVSDMPYGDETDVNPALLAEEAEDDFEEQLMDAMTTPIKDEDSASAVVPLIIRGPAELGEKIKQFKFERSFDPALAQRSDRVLERILQGLDVPKDIVTGLANVKYSNALQIDETLYKTHIEPLMLLIADALTVVYLRPSLIANGYSPADVEKVVVWYDPSAITTRNDRASDADMGFDKGALSYEAWRRMHGFTENDAPTPMETALRAVLGKGMISPELTEAVLGALSPELMDAVRAQQQASSPAPVPSNVQQMLQGGQPATPAAAPTDTAEAPQAVPAADNSNTVEPAPQAQTTEAPPSLEDILGSQPPKQP